MNMGISLNAETPFLSVQPEYKIAHQLNASPSSDGEKKNTISERVNLSREGILQSGKKSGDGKDEELSDEQRRVVEELKKRDQEVKAHERAHMAAGAGLVQGGASYEYKRGPDGKLYAVGGEVTIDTSAERDPDQTIRKMAQVKQAALAPSEPSGQDRAVAAQAAQIEAQARIEKNRQDREGDGGSAFKQPEPDSASFPDSELPHSSDRENDSPSVADSSFHMRGAAHASSRDPEDALKSRIRNVYSGFKGNGSPPKIHVSA